MGHNINKDKPPGKPPTMSQSSTRDMRLDLRWGVMFKDRLIVACISKKRAIHLVDAGNIGTPGGGVTLKDFNAEESS